MSAGQLDAVVGQRLSGDVGRLLERDARLVAVGAVADRHRGVEVGRHVEPVVVGPQAQAHLRRAARRARGLRDEVDLAAAVERDPRPGLDRAPDERRVLGRAVHRDERRVDPGGQRGVELARPERVAAQPLRVQDAAERQRQVGLERREQRDRALGPAVGERRARSGARSGGADPPTRRRPASRTGAPARRRRTPRSTAGPRGSRGSRRCGSRWRTWRPVYGTGGRRSVSRADGGHAPKCSRGRRRALPARARPAARAPVSRARDDAGDQRVSCAQRVDDPGGHGGLLEDGAVREHQAPVLAAPDDRRACSAAYCVAGQVGRLGEARARAPTGTPPRATGRGRGTAPCEAGGRRRRRVARPPRRRPPAPRRSRPGRSRAPMTGVFRNSTASSDGRNVALTPSTSESKTRSPSGVTVIVVRPVRPGATATWRMSIPRARPCARTNRPSSSSPTAPT